MFLGLFAMAFQLFIGLSWKGSYKSKGGSVDSGMSGLKNQLNWLS